MKVIYSNCYVAYVADDRNNSIVFGYFKSYSEALDAVKGKSSWGSDGYVDTSPLKILTITNELGEIKHYIDKPIEVIDKAVEYEYKKAKELARKIALAKLTKEDMMALDL